MQNHTRGRANFSPYVERGGCARGGACAPGHSFAGMPGISIRTTAGLLAATALAAAAPAAARPAPVAVKAVAAAPSTITAGGKVTAKAVVSARRAAKHVRLRYGLSRSTRASGAVAQLGAVTVGRVSAGKRVVRRTTLTIPAAVAAGRYHLVGCAGSACRAAALATRQRERSAS